MEGETRRENSSDDKAKRRMKRVEEERVRRKEEPREKKSRERARLTEGESVGERRKRDAKGTIDDEPR